MKHFSFFIFLFLAPLLHAHNDVPDEIVISYWKNCALYLFKLGLEEAPRQEVNLLTQRFITIREHLHLINHEKIIDFAKFVELIHLGD